MEIKIYRLLQRHLDKQAVGFPAAWSGADIRLLKRLFSPDEAKLALHLSYKPNADETDRRTCGCRVLRGADQAPAREHVRKRRHRLEGEGRDRPLVRPSAGDRHVRSTGRRSLSGVSRRIPRLFQDPELPAAFLAVKPSQMRTIPINQSIPVEHPVATYDQIRTSSTTLPAPSSCFPASAAGARR